MFTGIVTDIGEVVAVEPRAEGLARLRIACRYDPDTIDIGASIACSGVCLTVVGRGRDGNRGWFAVDAAAETLRVTTVGAWKRGARLNLERALKVGDELGGHIVAGHADGLATVVAREDLTDMARFTFRVPAECADLLRTGQVEVGLPPAIELATQNELVIVPGCSISSLGPVGSAQLRLYDGIEKCGNVIPRLTSKSGS